MRSISIRGKTWRNTDWRMVFRNKKTWGVILIAMILVAAGIAAYQLLFKAGTQVAETPQVQTAVARRGDLVIFASGAGQVIAATERNIGFDESGTLAEVLVHVGDTVQAGQVLARLQTDKSEEEIALALADAKLNELLAQQELDDIYANSEMDAAQALLDIENADNALEDLQDVNLRQAQALQAIAEAEAAVKDAQRIYNSVRLPADSNTIAAALAELVIAEKKLKDQQEIFNDYARKPDTNLDKANQQLKLSAVQQAYDTALRYYNAVTGTGTELDKESSAADLASAQAQLAQVQRDWDRIKDGPTPGEIALAKAQLAVAQTKYETLKNGPDPAEIALAQANLANTQAKLAVALEDKAIVELLAPMDGTILSIDASVGEAVGSTAIISLANLSQPVLEVYLDETDLDKVAVGYEVEVVFDSMPDVTFSGHVTEVSPILQSVSGVDTVVTNIQLDADSFSKPFSLPVGSNASVEVIGGRTENAILVPVEAVREIGPEEYAVFVMENGTPKLRVVTVGLMDYTSAEIITGLNPGDIVTTGLVETQQ